MWSDMVVSLAAYQLSRDCLRAKYNRAVGESRSPGISTGRHLSGSADVGSRCGQPWWSAIRRLSSGNLPRQDSPLRAVLATVPVPRDGPVAGRCQGRCDYRRYRPTHVAQAMSSPVVWPPQREHLIRRDLRAHLLPAPTPIDLPERGSTMRSKAAALSAVVWPKSGQRSLMAELRREARDRQVPLATGCLARM